MQRSHVEVKLSEFNVLRIVATAKAMYSNINPLNFQKFRLMDFSININYFFFSSRRRHTRCSRDWSSDVCSSDLNGKVLMTLGKAGVSGPGLDTFDQPTEVAVAPNGDIFVADGHGEQPAANARIKIGRASCRERV